MDNVVNFKDKRRIGKLKETAEELQSIIKAIELSKKTLLPHVQYSGVKRIVVDLDDSRKLYAGLYKKAIYEIRILNGEPLND